jgi:protoporphyrinogen oxidase
VGDGAAGGGTIRPSAPVVVIGAGPAGLTAAYKLSQARIPSIVLEMDHTVGGISRTVHHRGYHFDIGGHRFYTKVDAVERMWHEVLSDNLLLRSRLSRIYYNKKFFYYPLRAMNALFGLGVWNSTLIFLSYVKAHLFPVEERTFEDWVTNRFGERLYKTFFKTYTEKVWGIPCNQISADWAAQRIKGLSLLTALKNALLKQEKSSKGNVVKTLIDSFLYPKRGPGMMWETVADTVQKNGCQLRMGRSVERIRWRGDRIVSVDTAGDGGAETHGGSHFISSMPLAELVQKLDPAPPPEVLKAASMLKYRDFLTVALVVNKADLFPDNWIYIHDPSVKVGRIQNFKNWSPYMVPDPSKTCIGLEYFCFEGDGLWNTPDDALVELGKNEMQALGLVQAADVQDGAVVRMPKAYPVYDEIYAEAVAGIRSFLDTIDNLYPVGRNGMHKYNNQDHSMLTAMLAVENIRGAHHDVWSVNVDQEYSEEIREGEDERRRDLARIGETQPLVPQAVPAPDPATAALQKAFARLDKLALAVAVGGVSSCYILLATLWLLLKGGERVGPRLELLGQYFIGFTVSFQGAAVGALYGFFWGFVLGWLIAYLRNLTIGFYLHRIKRRSEADSIRDFLSYI